MPRIRTVALPKLAAFLVALREGFRWRQAQAADIAARRGIGITRQGLRGLEEGTTKNPDPELLRAVGTLYKVPYDEIVRRFVKERYGVDLASDDFKHAAEDRFGGLGRFVLEDREPQLIDAWRDSTREGQKAALAILATFKRPAKKTARGSAKAIEPRG